MSPHYRMLTKNIKRRLLLNRYSVERILVCTITVAAFGIVLLAWFGVNPAHRKLVANYNQLMRSSRRKDAQLSKTQQVKLQRGQSFNVMEFQPDDEEQMNINEDIADMNAAKSNAILVEPGGVEQKVPLPDGPRTGDKSIFAEAMDVNDHKDNLAQKANKQPFIPRHRIVHLDLKGAPPSVAYLEQFFALISSPALAATGVMIEWEDMLPYHDQLFPARNQNAYSDEDVQRILASARKNNLQIVPLIQTFGHLEWVLKLTEFVHLREVIRYPQNICPTNPEAVALVKMIIDQVMQYHMGSTFVHIGMDEVFHIGKCDECETKMLEQLGGSPDRLYLLHLKEIARYVQEKYKKRVLVWHDMLSRMDPRLLKTFKLADFVEPVVWEYGEQRPSDIERKHYWPAFADAFPFVWGASAFKGAGSPDQYYSNLPHYVGNNVAWQGAMQSLQPKFTDFRGIILTGWQRFDHFAVLCELLPVGIPALSTSLAALKSGSFDKYKTVKEATDALGCVNLLNIHESGAKTSCTFPGFRIFKLIEQLHECKEMIKKEIFDSYRRRAWLSEYNARQNYSNSYYLDELLASAALYRQDLTKIIQELIPEMALVYSQETIDEFMFLNVDEDLWKLSELTSTAHRLAGYVAFGQRPLPLLLLNEDFLLSLTEPPKPVVEHTTPETAAASASAPEDAMPLDHYDNRTENEAEVVV